MTKFILNLLRIKGICQGKNYLFMKKSLTILIRYNNDSNKKNLGS